MTMPEPAETVVVLPADTRPPEAIAEVAPEEIAEPAPALPADVQAAFAAVAPSASAAAEHASPERPDYLDTVQAAPDVPRPTTPGAIARVDLGDGQWADVRDPNEVRAGHRKAVTRRLRIEASLGASVVEVMEEVLSFAIVGWSLPMPLPSVNRASLDQLLNEQEDRLQEDPTIMEIAQRLSSNMRMLNPTQPSRDPNSPTAPSSV